tara:strand:- start:4769 stop:6271 length:1503 start_codon:yes stop_codon:yes gene_type:complete
VTSNNYIVALDQGTTSTTALLIDQMGSVIWKTSQEITTIYPRLGWVEQDPQEIFLSCLNVIHELIDETEISTGQISAIGITNQRETTLVWDRETGEPVYNAIVWQCRRSTMLCEVIKSQGVESDILRKTGLTLDPYFSSTKLRWIIDNIPNGQARAENGEIIFGTVDSWILWNLTGEVVHATDTTNASRTMLYNIDNLEWDKDLLNLFDIPPCILPTVHSSNSIFGHTLAELFRGKEIPVSAMAGDQNSALFGQGCFNPGMIKNTYGTGCFVLANSGGERINSKSGLISTISWQIDKNVTYGLEGSIFSSGSTIQWLKDGLGIINSVNEIDSLAESVEDNGGVYFVPSFTGLGAPNWDPNARGTIVGLTLGSNSGHIARASLEATAFQTRQVVESISKDLGFMPKVLRVDGGGTASSLMMQFQADILGIPIETSSIKDTTALGIGYIAGLSVGFWKDMNEIASLWMNERMFIPSMSDTRRENLYNEWFRAIDRSKNWVEP